MTTIQKNIIANFVGRSLSALLSFVFVPFYFELLGSEAYGLIGVYTALQTTLFLVDLGMSSAFTREAARLAILADQAEQLRNLSRTFETIFWVVGLLVVSVIGSLSQLIAEHWVNPEHLSTDTVSSAIMLMGLAIGLQFPFILYQGGLIGLQRQVLLNSILVSLGLLRGVGMILVLTYVAPVVQVFFVWQISVSALQLILGRVALWHSLPQTHARPRFRLSLLLPLLPFVAGIAGTTIIDVLLMQVDKLVLSKMLTLKSFGYYTLASTAASVPRLIATAVNSAVYPRFTQLVVVGEKSGLVSLYHRSCQFVAVLLAPVGLMLAFFSKELVFLWTGNETTTQNTSPLISILALGSILMGIMLLPYTLQLAHSWTKLGFCSNVSAILLLVPLLIWLTSTYGALGACFVWVVLYGGQILFTIPFMHRRILAYEKRRWYIDDVGKPLFAAFVVTLLGRLVIGELHSSLLLIMCLGLLLVVAMGSAAMSTPNTRRLLLAKLAASRGT